LTVHWVGPKIQWISFGQFHRGWRNPENLPLNGFSVNDKIESEESAPHRPDGILECHVCIEALSTGRKPAAGNTGMNAAQQRQFPAANQKRERPIRLVVFDPSGHQLKSLSQKPIGRSVEMKEHRAVNPHTF